MDSEAQTPRQQTGSDPGEPFTPISLDDGRYVLTDILGRGGTATVFQAYDTKLAQWRAIKVLSDQYAAHPSTRQRFDSEARMMAALEHPGIVRIYDIRSEKRPYIVMELVTGGSLYHWLSRNGEMPPRMAVEVVLQVCEAMAYAHAKNVIHRDIKPHNVLIDSRGGCRISDFGIGRVGEAGTNDTRTGVVMGTVGFMAPEQRIGTREVDARADVYSIGAMLWSLLRNEQPGDLFMAEHDSEILDGVHEALHDVLRTATRHRSSERLATVDELADALLALMPELPGLPPDTPPLASQFTETREPPDVTKTTRLRSLSTFTLEVEAVQPSGETILPGAGSADTDIQYMTQLLDSPTGGFSHIAELASVARSGEFTSYFLDLPRDPALHVRAVMELAAREGTAEASPDAAEVLAHRSEIESALRRWSAPVKRSVVPMLAGAFAGAMLLTCGVGWVALQSGLIAVPASARAVTGPIAEHHVIAEKAARPTPLATDTEEVVRADTPTDPRADGDAAQPPPSGGDEQPEVRPRVGRAASPPAGPTTGAHDSNEDPGVVAAAADDEDPSTVATLDGTDEPPAEEPEALEPDPSDALAMVDEPEAPAPPPADPGTDAPAAPPEWRIYANANAKGLSAAQVKQVFTGRMPYWPDGQRVVVILPPASSDAMEWITQTVGMPDAAIRRTLKQRAFQGAIESPVEAASLAAASSSLVRTPGGVTVLLDSNAPSGVRSLTP